MFRLVAQVLMVAVLVSELPAAQSQNPAAQRWFSLASSRPSLDARISALRTALAYDPAFIEARIALALALEQQRRFNAAEQHLRTALAQSRATGQETALQLHALLTLGAFYERQERLAERNACLQQARALAPDIETLSTIERVLQAGTQARLDTTHNQARKRRRPAKLPSGKPAAPAVLQVPERELAQGLLAHYYDSLDSLYERARLQLQQHDWRRAAHTLHMLRAIQPGYRNTPDLWRILQANLSDTSSAAAASPPPSSSGAIWLYGLAACAMAFALVVWRVPTARAALLVRLHRYESAAKIYEQCLQANPALIRLYPRLAHLYLISGRRDRFALNVFQLVLKLNLATEDRELLRGILAQHRWPTHRPRLLTAGSAAKATGV